MPLQPVSKAFPASRKLRRLTVYRGPATITCNSGSQVTGDSRVYFRVTGSGHLTFEMPFDLPRGDSFSGKTVGHSIVFPLLGLKCRSLDLFPGNVREDGRIGRFTLQGGIHGVDHPPASVAAERVQFLVCNGPRYLGDLVQMNDGRNLIGGQHLEFDFLSCRLRISSAHLAGLPEFVPRSRDATPSHLGELLPIEGSVITREHADTAINALSMVLSFMRSASTPVLFGHGLLHGKEIAWRDWTPKFVHPLSPELGWAHFVRIDANSLIPSLGQLAQRSPWKDSLPEAVDMYAEACQSRLSHPNSLAIAQIPLELLAWTHCVLDRHLISKKGFERLSTADRLRLFLKDLDISTLIRPANPALISACKPFGWVDLADVISECRNASVHPVPRIGASRSNIPTSVFEVAREAALWAFESAVLRLSGYNGRYWDRLATADEQRAPHGVLFPKSSRRL